jgi:hypothetical protein
LAPPGLNARREFSKAFREFPSETGLYFTPTQAGRLNLLWERPTGYGVVQSTYGPAGLFNGRLPDLSAADNGREYGFIRVSRRTTT